MRVCRRARLPGVGLTAVDLRAFRARAFRARAFRSCAFPGSALFESRALRVLRPSGPAPFIASFQALAKGTADADILAHEATALNLLAYRDETTMPGKTNDLSRRERQIVDYLYSAGRATAAEVLEAIPDPPGTPPSGRRFAFSEQEDVLRRRMVGRTSSSL